MGAGQTYLAQLCHERHVLRVHFGAVLSVDDRVSWQVAGLTAGNHGRVGHLGWTLLYTILGYVAGATTFGTDDLIGYYRLCLCNLSQLPGERERERRVDG